MQILFFFNTTLLCVENLARVEFYNYTVNYDNIFLLFKY